MSHIWPWDEWGFSGYSGSNDNAWREELINQAMKERMQHTMTQGLWVIREVTSPLQNFSGGEWLIAKPSQVKLKTGNVSYL